MLGRVGWVGVSDMSIFLSAPPCAEACQGCLTGSDILYDRLDSLVSQALPKLKPITESTFFSHHQCQVEYLWTYII